MRKIRYAMRKLTREEIEKSFKECSGLEFLGFLNDPKSKIASIFRPVKDNPGQYEIKPTPQDGA